MGPGRTLFAEVAVEGGIVRATFWDYTPADIAKLVGAKVRLTGNAGTLNDETAQLRGVSMLINRTSDVVILEPAESPFSLPLQPLESLYRHLSAREPFRRSRVSGVVTAYVPGRPLTVHDNASGHTFSATAHVLYIQDGTGVARVETDKPAVVSPGDRVDVAGFPYVTGGKPVLKYADVRVVGSGAEPQPVELPLPFVLTPDRDASLVSLRARLLGVVASSTRRALVIEAGDGTIDATLHGGPSDDAMARIQARKPRPGYGSLRVSGWLATVLSSCSSAHPAMSSCCRRRRGGRWDTRRCSPALLTTVVAAAAVWTWASARRRRQRYQAILDERTRVARELHDTLEQGLAGIALQLEAVAGTLGPSTEPARRPLDLARRMLRYSLEEARRSVSTCDRRRWRRRTWRARSPAWLRGWRRALALPPASGSQAFREGSMPSVSTICCASGSRR